ncbi:MAG: alanine:cation symporter family protein [Bacteroidales bacterium]|nr:alanine:cation symporter family protein [Bacteroidales bacterium]
MDAIFAADGWLNGAITSANDFLWTYILIAALIGCALFFTFKTKGVQFRMLGEMVRLLGDSASTGKSEKKVSSFQAFAVSVATRVGTGNLAGVAVAIAGGGPGAVFWMWIIALLGSADAFVESTLAQLYKKKGKDSFIGGPAYYMKHGLHKGWMGAIFAVLITITFGLSYNSIQSNTICASLDATFGFDPFWVGVVLTVISLLVVFGGISRVAKVSSILVPIMAIGYFILALVVVAMNITSIPSVLEDIFASAFGFRQVMGGGLGATISLGIRRGLFSNEAGEGSAPNVAATADVTHPVKQGLIQTLGVFTDTILICSCTAFIILCSGNYNSGLTGINLTQAALESEVGAAGSIFVSFAILLFAFSSIIGNSYYGETNIQFLTKKKWVLTVYRLCSCGLVLMFGAVASLDLVWSLGDICMGLMTACNLIAIAMLGKWAFRLLDDYMKQKKAGIKDPVFHKSTLPEIADDIECWD